MSGPARRTSAVPVSPEAVLFRAYGTIPPGKYGMFRVTDQRIEQCACGGVIAVAARSPVGAAVRAHNATREHRAWRVRHGASDG